MELIAGYSEKQVYDVFYKHYLEFETKKRLEAIELLKGKNFNELSKTSYYEYTNKEIVLTSVLLEDLLKEFQDILLNLPENSNKPELSIEGSDNTYNVVNYCVYIIRPFESCLSRAKDTTNNIIWRIKKMPDNKNTSDYLRLFNELIENDKPSVIKNCSTCKNELLRY